MSATNRCQFEAPSPSCRLTLSASKRVLCGTLMAPLLSPVAICSVLLQTTRTEVNCAVVASVPSQAVASSR